jgi:hypothetical protein
MPVHIGWRWNRRDKILQSGKRIENPHFEEVCMSGVIFQKAYELRILSSEASEDKVKF